MRARVSQIRVLADGKEDGGGHLNSCLGRVCYREAESGQGERTKDQARGGTARVPLLFRFIRSVRRVDTMHLFLLGLFGGHGRGSPRQELSSEL